jgi:hypothetical protein
VDGAGGEGVATVEGARETAGEDGEERESESGEGERRTSNVQAFPGGQPRSNEGKEGFNRRERS